MSRGLHQFMQSPVLQHEAQGEHQHPEGPEDCYRRHFSILSVPYPQPSEEEHRQAVDRPQGKHASDGLIGGKLPGQLDGVTEDLACRRGQHRCLRKDGVFAHRDSAMRSYRRVRTTYLL